MAKHKVNLGKSPELINSAKLVQSLYKQGEHILKAARQALKVGVDNIVNDAKILCPVDTGTLQQSISASTFGVGAAKGTGYLITASAKAKNTVKRGKGKDAPQEQVDYAQYVEFDPRINKPYLYPSISKNRKQLYKLIRTAIEVASRGNG